MDCGFNAIRYRVLKSTVADCILVKRQGYHFSGDWADTGLGGDVLSFSCLAAALGAVLGLAKNGTGFHHNVFRFVIGRFFAGC